MARRLAKPPRVQKPCPRALDRGMLDKLRLLLVVEAQDRLKIMLHPDDPDPSLSFDARACWEHIKEHHPQEHHPQLERCWCTVTQKSEQWAKKLLDKDKNTGDKALQLPMPPSVHAHHASARFIYPMDEDVKREFALHADSDTLSTTADVRPDPLSCLFILGGFAFFDANDNFVALYALGAPCPYDYASPVLRFEGPFPAYLSETERHSLLANELFAPSRLQAVTLPVLKDRGVEQFMFLHPELQTDANGDGKPDGPTTLRTRGIKAWEKRIPDGAFIYIYCEKATHYDCLFKLVGVERPDTRLHVDGTQRADWRLRVDHVLTNLEGVTWHEMPAEAKGAKEGKVSVRGNVPARDLVAALCEAKVVARPLEARDEQPAAAVPAPAHALPDDRDVRKEEWQENMLTALGRVEGSINNLTSALKSEDPYVEAGTTPRDSLSLADARAQAKWPQQFNGTTWVKTYPVEVRTSVEILQLIGINQAEQTWEAELKLNFEWSDAWFVKEFMASDKFKDKWRAKSWQHAMRYYCWHPNVQIENKVGDMHREVWYNVLCSETGKQWDAETEAEREARGDVAHSPVMQMRCAIKGTFAERLELKFFPFDIQDLTLHARSGYELHEVRFAPELPSRGADKLSLDFKFASGAGNKLSEGISTALEVDKGIGWMLPDWAAVETVRTVFRISAASFRSRGNWTERNYPALSFTMCVQRDPTFYCTNVVLIVGVVTTVAWFCELIPNFEDGDKLAVLATLLLTTILFKGTVVDLPKLSYLTWLDYYVLASVLFLGGLCCVAALKPTYRRRAYDEGESTDDDGLLYPTSDRYSWVWYAALAVWVLWNIFWFLGGLAMRETQRELRLMAARTGEVSTQKLPLQLQLFGFPAAGQVGYRGEHRPLEKDTRLAVLDHVSIAVRLDEERGGIRSERVRWERYSFMPYQEFQCSRPGCVQRLLGVRAWKGPQHASQMAEDSLPLPDPRNRLNAQELGSKSTSLRGSGKLSKDAKPQLISYTVSEHVPTQAMNDATEGGGLSEFSSRLERCAPRSAAHAPRTRTSPADSQPYAARRLLYDLESKHANLWRHSTHLVVHTEQTGGKKKKPPRPRSSAASMRGPMSSPLSLSSQGDDDDFEINDDEFILEPPRLILRSDNHVSLADDQMSLHGRARGSIMSAVGRLGSSFSGHRSFIRRSQMREAPAA